MQIVSSGNYQHAQMQQKFGMTLNQKLVKMFKKADYDYIRDASPTDIKDVYCLEHHSKKSIEEARDHVIDNKVAEDAREYRDLQIGAGRGDSYRGEGSQSGYTHSEGVSLSEIERRQPYQSTPNYIQRSPSPTAQGTPWSSSYPEQPQGGSNTPPSSYVPPQGSMMMAPPIQRRDSSILTRDNRSMISLVNKTPTAPGETWETYRDKLNTLRTYGKKLFTENALIRFFDKRKALQTRNPVNAEPAQMGVGRDDAPYGYKTKANKDGSVTPRKKPVPPSAFKPGHKRSGRPKREDVDDTMRTATGKTAGRLKSSTRPGYGTPEYKDKESRRHAKRKGKQGLTYLPASKKESERMPASKDGTSVWDSDHYDKN